MVEHTPTPWGYTSRDWCGRESEFDYYVSGDASEDDEGGSATAVAIVKGNATAGNIPLANAALICRAVNSHAALVAAIETAIGMLDAEVERCLDSHLSSSAAFEQSVANVLESALKLAKGE